MKQKFLIFFILTLFLTALVFAVYLINYEKGKNETIDDLNSKIDELVNKKPEDPKIPNIKTEVILDKLEGTWDIAFINESSFLFTEKVNNIKFYDNGTLKDLGGIADVAVRGEGGLLGMALDSKFSENGYAYFCFNSTLEGLDVRVVRFSVDLNALTLSERKDLVTGIPSNQSGRHSGCQIEFSKDEILWIGTGDAAVSSHPQDPKSLGGKILRVDREGNAVEGNLAEPFDPRIYSYGHRNTQGIALFENNEFSIDGVSAEHGSTVDDEINALVPGNFGWDPKPPYDESVLMTDLSKFPDAVASIWSSGNPTIASSGVTLIKGAGWGYWENAIAFANLKGERVVVLKLSKDFQVISEHEILKSEFGRIRTIQMGLDGNLYLLTSNGAEKDMIVRVSVSE